MGKKILIVDDDPGVRYTVKNGLEGFNNDYQVVTVESGRECLNMLESDEIPDLILLDIMMPEMSGWQTFDKIRENADWKQIPIIFLTARTDNVARNAGGFLAEDYIGKPFQIPELKEHIDKILKK